jgi:hypothetical protein
LISTVVAPARSAMNRSEARVIARFWRPISAQDGIVFHAAAAAGAAQRVEHLGPHFSMRSNVVVDSLRLDADHEACALRHQRG